MILKEVAALKSYFLPYGMVYQIQFHWSVIINILGHIDRFDIS